MPGLSEAKAGFNVKLARFNALRFTKQIFVGHHPDSHYTP